jgi:hypothetical protein
VHLPIWLSLGVIAAILGASLVASLVWPPAPVEELETSS